MLELAQQKHSNITVAELQGASVPNTIIVLQPRLKDTREALFVDAPMHLFGPTPSVEWFRFVLSLAIDMANSRWLAKTVYINISSLELQNGQPVALANGARQFLKWYYEGYHEDTTTPIRGGICRAGFALLPPVQTDTRDAHVEIQYAGPELVATNGDYLYPTFAAAYKAGLVPRYLKLYDTIHSQMIGAPLQQYHAPYLERQISFFGLRAVGGHRDKLFMLRRLIEDMTRELNNVVLQFHHSFNQLYVTSPDSPKGRKWGDKRRILPNQWLWCLLVISIAPLLADLKTLLGLGLTKRLGLLTPTSKQSTSDTYQKHLWGFAILTCQTLIVWIYASVKLRLALTLTRPLGSALCSDTTYSGANILMHSNLLYLFVASICVVCGTVLVLPTTERATCLSVVVRSSRLALPPLAALIAIVSPPLAFLFVPIAAGVLTLHLILRAERVRDVTAAAGVTAVGMLAVSSHMLYYPSPFLSSSLMSAIVTSPFSLVQAAASASLTAHVCVGYSSFPIFLLGCSYLANSLFTVCLELGHHFRKQLTAWNTNNLHSKLD
eukprot:Blabericola_migrator_1__11829@NODE_719_length_6741_cov_45_534312_g518_i0_p2_GENE_NODE_719_length_6741_cov_45_534312_g518_i0NODE_719_length_6741_cov_45_534312_g518_i0_p2_ORF_typecomplete_len551_score43_61Gaa1/PF04114_14/8_2e15Gaa1/PF04114_14/1_8e04_NODE_719_length_6741_cov_45_534312_g518_i07522404